MASQSWWFPVSTAQVWLMVILISTLEVHSMNNHSGDCHYNLFKKLKELWQQDDYSILIARTINL